MHVRTHLFSIARSLPHSQLGDSEAHFTTTKVINKSACKMGKTLGTIAHPICISSGGLWSQFLRLYVFATTCLTWKYVLCIFTGLFSHHYMDKYCGIWCIYKMDDFEAACFTDHMVQWPIQINPDLLAPKVDFLFLSHLAGSTFPSQNDLN